ANSRNAKNAAQKNNIQGFPRTMRLRKHLKGPPLPSPLLRRRRGGRKRKRSSMFFAIDLETPVSLAKLMISKKFPEIVVGSLFIALVCSARADVRLAALFADNMVLQQEMRAPV